MEIILHLTVIVFSLYFFSRLVRLRIWKQIIDIHMDFVHQSTAFIITNDAVGYLRLKRRQDRKLKEVAPWLRE